MDWHERCGTLSRLAKTCRASHTELKRCFPNSLLLWSDSSSDITAARIPFHATHDRMFLLNPLRHRLMSEWYQHGFLYLLSRPCPHTGEMD